MAMVRAAAIPGFDDGLSSVADLAQQPIAGTAGVLPGDGDRLVGQLPEGAEIFVAQTHDSGWHMSVQGEPTARRRSLGWATVFLPDRGGEAVLSYDTPLWRRAVLVLQLGGFAALAAVALRRRLGGAR